MRQLPQTNFDKVLSKIYESYSKPIPLAPPGPMRPRPIPSSWGEDPEKPKPIPLSRVSGLAKIKQLIRGEGEMDIDDFIDSVAEEIGIEITLSPNGDTVEYYGTGIVDSEKPEPIPLSRR